MSVGPVKAAAEAAFAALCALEDQLDRATSEQRLLDDDETFAISLVSVRFAHDTNRKIDRAFVERAEAKAPAVGS